MAIKLFSLIIKPVRNFVTNYTAFCAVIDGVVLLRIKERRLKNAGREIDGVGLRIIVGVDGGRRHLPFLAVQGFADFLELPVELELRAAMEILEIAVRRGS